METTSTTVVADVNSNLPGATVCDSTKTETSSDCSNNSSVASTLSVSFSNDPISQQQFTSPLPLRKRRKSAGPSVSGSSSQPDLSSDDLRLEQASILLSSPKTPSTHPPGGLQPLAPSIDSPAAPGPGQVAPGALGLSPGAGAVPTSNSTNLSSAAAAASNNRIAWTPQEIRLFYDGLRIYGKRFDHITSYIKAKTARTSSKEFGQVKNFFTNQLRTMVHKMETQATQECKTLYGSVSREAKELFILINFGEWMRKSGLHEIKVRHFPKFQELLMKGVVTVRAVNAQNKKQKSRIVRIKTPPSAALKRLCGCPSSEAPPPDDLNSVPAEIPVQIVPRRNKDAQFVSSRQQNPFVRGTFAASLTVEQILTFLKRKWSAPLARPAQEPGASFDPDPAAPLEGLRLKLFPSPKHQLAPLTLRPTTVHNSAMQRQHCYVSLELCFQHQTGRNWNYSAPAGHVTVAGQQKPPAASAFSAVAQQQPQAMVSNYSAIADAALIANSSNGIELLANVAASAVAAGRHGSFGRENMAPAPDLTATIVSPGAVSSGQVCGLSASQNGPVAEQPAPTGGTSSGPPIKQPYNVNAVSTDVTAVRAYVIPVALIENGIGSYVPDEEANENFRRSEGPGSTEVALPEGGSVNVAERTKTAAIQLTVGHLYLMCSKPNTLILEYDVDHEVVDAQLVNGAWASLLNLLRSEFLEASQKRFLSMMPGAENMLSSLQTSAYPRPDGSNPFKVPQMPPLRAAPSMPPPPAVSSQQAPPSSSSTVTPSTDPFKTAPSELSQPNVAVSAPIPSPLAPSSVSGPPEDQTLTPVPEASMPVVAMETTEIPACTALTSHSSSTSPAVARSGSGTMVKQLATAEPRQSTPEAVLLTSSPVGSGGSGMIGEATPPPPQTLMDRENEAFKNQLERMGFASGVNRAGQRRRVVVRAIAQETAFQQQPEALPPVEG